MARPLAYAKVNGKKVPVYEYDPATGRDVSQPFFRNPGAQQAVATMLGMGVAGYNAAKGFIGALPNPPKTKLQRALPWATLCALCIFASRRGGALRVPFMVAAGGTGGKALLELMRS